MKYLFGYYGDFDSQNAFNGIKMFNNSSFDIDTIFYRLDGGLSQIITTLAHHLTSKGVTIKTETECISIQQTKTETQSSFECTTNKGTLIGENIIFAIPKANLASINYLKKYSDLLDSVTSK